MAGDKSEKRKKKLNIAAETKNLDEGERRRLHRLLRLTGFRKKSEKKQRRTLPKLIDLVRNNEERRDNEEKFAHNVTVTQKHERRRRWKVRWRLYTFLITGGFILLLAGYIIFSYVLVIDEISVVGTERYASEEIISESGITVGTRLFSPSIDADAAATSIINRFPYINKVEVERHLPDRVILRVVEEEAVFVSVIHDEYVILSRGLRVLEIRADEPSGDYIRLKLSGVTRAVFGDKLSFEGDLLKVVEKAVDAVCAENVRERTSVLDVSDRFNISISYAGRFKLEFGSVNDIDVKLRIAFKIIEGDTFAEGSRGTINLRDVEKPTVIVDDEIDLN